MSKVYAGLYRGIVSNVNDPEMRARIKCIIPDVLGDTEESAWCEPCINCASDNIGDLYIPQIKDTIWIMFEKGDCNKPVWMGNWYKPQQTPLGTNYNSLYRVISHQGLKLIFAGNNLTITGNVTISGTVKASNI